MVLNGVKGYIPFAFSGWNRAVTSVRAAQLLPDPLPYAIGTTPSALNYLLLFTHSFTHSRTYSLTHSLTHLLIDSLIHSLIHSIVDVKLAHSFT